MKRFQYSTCPVCKSDKIHNQGGKLAEHFLNCSRVKCSGSGLPADAMTLATVLKNRLTNTGKSSARIILPYFKPPFERNGVRYCPDGKGVIVCTGAQMGRANAVPVDHLTVRKMHLVKVPMFDGKCYDKGGAYWGNCSVPIWCAWGESETEQAYCFFRAATRELAKVEAWRVFPSAIFYR